MSFIGKTVRFVAGFALGAGVGTVTALLLAPQSGESSQRGIQQRVMDVLTAGRTASRQREDELYAAWEAELGTARGERKNGKQPAAPMPALDQERAKARRAAGQ